MSKLAALRWQVRIFWVIFLFIFHKTLQSPDVSTTEANSNLIWCTSHLLNVSFFSCVWLNLMFYLLWPQSIQDVDSKLSSSAWPRNEIKSDQGLWRGGEFADGCSLLSFTIAIPSEQEQMCDISCWNMCLIEGNGLENSRKVSIRSGEPCNDLTFDTSVFLTPWWPQSKQALSAMLKEKSGPDQDIRVTESCGWSKMIG